MAELRQFGEGQTVETPERLKKKGFARKVGEFIAPTTTGLITGEKEFTPRTVFGAALEVGSLAVPSGAILRGFGIAGRALRFGARAVKGAKAVQKAAKPVTLGGIQKGAGEIGRDVKRKAFEGAKIAGPTGAAFAGGRALGEEDLSIKEVIGEAAIGGALGVAGGAILTPAISLIARGGKAGVGVLSNSMRSVNARLNPIARKAAIDDLTNSTIKSVAENEPLFKSLGQLAKNAQRIEGPDFNQTSLLKELYDIGGYVPKTRGGIFAEQRFNFEDAIKHANARRKPLSEGVTRIAKGIKVKTKLSDLEKAAKAQQIGRTDIEPIKVTNQISTIVKNLKKEFKTDILSAEQVDIIRKRTTAGTTSFAKAAKGKAFVGDAQNALRSVSRSRLDDIAEDITRLNAQSGQLARIIKTMELLNGSKIDVGFLSTTFGRYIGVIAGAGFIASGPGALVVAGLMAQLGSRFVANMIRQFRFNPRMQSIIRQGLRSDAKLLQEVLKDAAPLDAVLINRFIQRGKNATIITKTATEKAIQSKSPISKSITDGSKKGKSVFGKPGQPPPVKEQIRLGEELRKKALRGLSKTSFGR